LQCKGGNLKEVYEIFQTAWYFEYFIRNIENIHWIEVTWKLYVVCTSFTKTKPPLPH